MALMAAWGASVISDCSASNLRSNLGARVPESHASGQPIGPPKMDAEVRGAVAAAMPSATAREARGPTHVSFEGL